MSSTLLARSSSLSTTSSRRAQCPANFLPFSPRFVPQQQQQQRQRVVSSAGENLYSGNATNREALPAKVTLPPVQPEVPPPTFGFVDNAERINSRACMIGFFALIALEYFANAGLLDMLGFTTGNGLGFEL